MIKNYGDHAANERTFLAWVRTANAVMTRCLRGAAEEYFSRHVVVQPDHPVEEPGARGADP
jgi:hypothetical protein